MKTHSLFLYFLKLNTAVRARRDVLRNVYGLAIRSGARRNLVMNLGRDLNRIATLGTAVGRQGN